MAQEPRLTPHEKTGLVVAGLLFVLGVVLIVTSGSWRTGLSCLFGVGIVYNVLAGAKIRRRQALDPQDQHER